MDPRTPTPNGPQPDDSDDFLEEVARVARDDEMADSEHLERMKKLAAGKLSQGELAKLRAEAETSDELARDLEAFRPLGDEFHERVVQRLRNETGRATSGPEAEVVAFDRDRTRSERRRRRNPWAWPALAAAAVVLVFLGPWLYRQIATPGFQVPGYSAELTGALQDVRGEETGDVRPLAELPEFGHGSILRLTLTPDAEPERRPDFTFYFSNAQGEVFEWDRFFRDGAAVRLEEELGADLVLEPGLWIVHFVYSEPGDLPEVETADDLEAESDANAKRWRSETVTFRVLADESAASSKSSLLEVLYAGCAEVTSGPVCVPDEDGPLTLWERAPPRADVTVRLGDRVLEPVAEIDGGRTYVVTATPADGEIVVTARLAGRHLDFRLPLEASRLPDWVRPAHERLDRWEVDGLREELQPRFDAGGDEVEGWIAWLEAYLGDTTPEEKRELLATAVRSHRANGQLKEWFWSLGALLHQDLSARRLGQIRQRLDAVTPLPTNYPAEAHFLAAFYRGHLESAVGNPRGALQHRRRAAEIARRVNQTRFVASAHTELAETLYLVGRGDEADELFESTTSSRWFQSFSPCFQANHLLSQSWTRLLADRDPAEVLPILDRADATAQRGGCGGSLPLNLPINRALAFYLEGRHFEARRVLAEVEAALDDATAKQQLWWHDVSARVDLAEGYPESALEHARSLDRVVNSAFEPRGRWRGLVLRAYALDDLQQADESLAAFAAAEALLDERSFEVPMDQGRGRFLAERQDAVERHLDLLLRSGRNVEALDLARRSRNRVLRTIRSHQRLAHLTPQRQLAWDRHMASYLELRQKAESSALGEWRLAADRRDAASRRHDELRDRARQALDLAFRQVGAESRDLPPLPPGDLVLAYHPVPTGWIAFAAGQPPVVVRRPVDLPDGALDEPETLAERLLEPFRPQIDAAESIRILPFGPLQRVDFHALPWNGEPLLAHALVTYGLDLDVGPRPAQPVPPGVQRALVVGDPRLDLPAARREAQQVEATLRSHPDLQVESLEGARASRQALRRLLPTMDLFHYAGHGVVAGPGGWDSALRLASGQSLLLGDVLALDRTPRQVVLSSCESAGSDPDPAVALGLAQAFVVSGSHTVVASTRPVGDRDTETFVRRVYDGWRPGGGDELAQRVRAAQLAWHAEDPAADWSSFRILVP